jgi:hypothetical protein
MWHNSELISQTDRCAHLKSKFNLSDQLTLDAGSRLARGGRKLPKAPKAIQAGAVPKIETGDRGGGPAVSCGMPRQRRCAEGLSGTAWATQTAEGPP